MRRLISAVAVLAALAVGCGTDRPAPQVRAEVGFALGGGINELSDDRMVDQLDDLAELGVKWIRVDFGWSVIENTEGELDWSRSDLIVSEAGERGINVLALLAYSPDWARPDDSSDKHPPLDADRFGEFAAAAAERYRGEVTHWEIWNEPNHAPFWEGGIDPAYYADLHTAAAREIRAVVPGSFIVSGGLSPAVDDSPSMSPETFIAQFLPLVPGNLIDAVGIHPYSFPARPADDGKGWNTFGRLPAIKAQVDEINPGLSLWLTEYGAPTGDGSNDVSLDDQATLIAEAINCSTRWEWAGPLFVYTWTDWPQEHFGVVDADRGAKPSLVAIQELIDGAAVASSCDLS